MLQQRTCFVEPSEVYAKPSYEANTGFISWQQQYSWMLGGRHAKPENLLTCLLNRQVKYHLKQVCQLLV